MKQGSAVIRRIQLTEKGNALSEKRNQYFFEVVPAANKLEITESGKLWGDLNINTILLHEGAYHEGQTNMANAVAPPTIEPPRLGRMPQLGSSGKPARDSDS